MNRRQYLSLARTGAGVVTLATMAGCLEDLPGSDSTTSVPVDDRTGERELDRAVGALNEAAFALLVEDDLEEPTAVEFDPAEPSDSIATARDHLETAASELDDRGEDIERLRTYADVLERLVGVTETVTDETIEADVEAAFGAIEGDDETEGDDDGDDAESDLDEGTTAGDDGDSAETDPDTETDDSDDGSETESDSGDDGDSDLEDASRRIDDRTDEFAVAESAHEEAAADVAEFDDRFADLARINPAELEDGVATLGDALDSLVTLGDGLDEMLDGYEALERGRDHMETEAHGEADDAFAEAESSFQSATATLESDEEPPAGIAGHVETARCKCEHLTDAASSFGEWATATADGDSEAAQVHRDEGDHSLEEARNCSSDSDSESESDPESDSDADSESA